MKLRLSILAVLALVAASGGIARSATTGPGGSHRLAPGDGTKVDRSGRSDQLLCTRMGA